MIFVFLGHSQGCTDFVVMATERPEYNAKIKSFQALAPPIFMKHQPNILLQIIARFETQLGVQKHNFILKKNKYPLQICYYFSGLLQQLV